MATGQQEARDDWAEKLLTDLASKARLAALPAQTRLDLVGAIRTIGAHKSWAYKRAVSGVRNEPGSAMLPRLAQAVALLNSHMIDINGIPMRTDVSALDPHAQAQELAEVVQGDGPATGAGEQTAVEVTAQATQQQLF